jgi:ubiquinone/menaquinone biosynthesis C-methylase UbiE
MNQEAYWDSVAGIKEFTVKFYPEMIAGLVPVNAPLLDFGCGYGRTLEELDQLGYTSLHGLDISAKMLEIASSRLPGAKFSRCANFKIPYPDAFFSGVLLIAVLTSIQTSADQELLLSELVRVLKPGGFIYAGDFLLNTDERNLKRYSQFEGKYHQYGVFEPEPGVVLRHHSLDYIIKLFSNFELIEFKETVHRTMNGNTSNGFILTGTVKK